MLSRHLFKFGYYLTSGFFLFLTTSAIRQALQPEQFIASANPVPTVIAVDENGNQYLMPDWSQIQFSTLPPIQESGSFTATSEAIDALGYDPSRSWSAGQTPDEFMMLGDFQEAFELENLSLRDICSEVGCDAQNESLADFQLMSKQTVGSLLSAVDGLEDEKIEDVPPLQDLFAKTSYYVDENDTIEEFLDAHPKLKKLKLDKLDLADYQVEDIPGLDKISLEKLENWENTYINQIPGLAYLSFDSFPVVPGTATTGIAKVDVVFSSAEKIALRSVSGSYEEGFHVNCTDQDCAHIELAGFPFVEGSQWISGKDQKVQGGQGILKFVNGGKEPTGRHPFGKAFKVVVWETDEGSGQVDTALFFRVCQRIFFSQTCTPYFVGPIPWLTHSEEDWIFTGISE